MSIPVTAIQNVSNQTIEILHEVGDPTNSAGDVSTQSTGMMKIPAGRKVTIETSRLDLGQLANLEAKNLIKTSNSVE